MRLETSEFESFESRVQLAGECEGSRRNKSHRPNAQFEYINAQAEAFIATNEPIVSVDTKKKELVGDFKNSGREWHPKGHPERAQVHDFVDPELGKAIPYGI